MLTMADGPVANLPPGMDAYGGYVNHSGIGVTWPAVQVLAAREHARAFSITTNGSPAECADVERGAMSGWTGYDYGYCSVSSVNAMVKAFGRPRKLWTAHQDPRIGRHICSPACWPGLVTVADGTQWVDHQGRWDESTLNDNFFDLSIPPIPYAKEETMHVTQLTNSRLAIAGIGAGPNAGHVLVFSVNEDGTAPSVIDVTDGIGTKGPNNSLYTVSG